MLPLQLKIYGRILILDPPISPRVLDKLEKENMSFP
jgi:hypothetical protein